jgi:hypothetical protein
MKRVPAPDVWIKKVFTSWIVIGFAIYSSSQGIVRYHAQKEVSILYLKVGSFSGGVLEVQKCMDEQDQEEYNPGMPDEENPLETLKFLISRLERLSADSFWAHRASGLRGTLLRCLEDLENNRLPDSPGTWQLINSLFGQAYWMLANAAREIRVPDDYQRVKPAPTHKPT